MTRKHNDFNGDGMDDIVWRNDAGVVQLWDMSGSTILHANSLGAVPNNWNILGTGDFNGDNKTDFIWRNDAGVTQIWNMNDGTIASTRALGVIPANWKLLGTDDFNGDGKTDLLWRNDAGVTQIWNMDDGTIVSTRSLGVIPANWNLAGTGDFNGDGKADLLWRNDAGVTQIWNMNDGTILNTPSLGVIPANWKVGAVDDFNGDGKTDLLWRNDTGVTQIWNMNSDGTIASTRSLGIIPLNWTLAGSGDFNGDGMADLLWRNDAGVVQMWQMNDGTISQATSLGVIPANWRIVLPGSNINTVTGTSGNDSLSGTSQVDNIYGLDGNDRLQGLAGNDTLDGGNGFDRAVYADATGSVTVNLAAGTAGGAGVGTDTLVGIEAAYGSAFADTLTAAGFTGLTGQPGVGAGQSGFEGAGGNDTITGAINALGQSMTRVEYLNASAAVTVDLAAGTGQGTAAGDAANVGVDTFTNALQGVWGSAYGDTIYGRNNGPFTFEAFEGRGGNDFIDGRGGYDIANYNNDTTTTSGITVNLAAGTVTGDSTVGTDTLRDVEAVRGTNFADVLDATGYGLAGALNISSTQGNFVDFAGAGGNDTIIGNGNTRLNFQIAAAAVTVDLQVTAGTALTVAGASSGATEGVDTFTGVNAVQGSMFGDTLLGSSFNNQFIGLGGDDLIDGRGGFDIAIYQSLSTVTGPVTVNLAAGVASGNASIGTDTLRNIEGVQGTNFVDTFNATGYGLAGAANVSTSNGNFNQFEGLAGNDSITGNGATRAVYGNATSAVTITIGAGGTGSGSGDASVGTDTFTGGVNGGWGSNFADTYNASAYTGGNTFQGNGGNDTITGNGSTRVEFFNTSGAVTITIGAGGAGSATGDSSVGTDTFTGGVNAAIAGNFADTYNASAFNNGFNWFQGNGGNDTITGNGSTQIRYDTATAAVTVNLSTGTATGDGSVGTDTITGGVNNVLGSNFGDNITGSANVDFLFGGAGNDRLQGLGGNDQLDGGLGFDRAVYGDATGGVTVNLAAGTASGAGVGSDTLIGIEAISGSNFADTLDATGFTGDTGTPGTQVGFNEFEGRGGNDTITGGTNSQGAMLTRISYANATAAVTVDLAAHSATGDSSVGTDTLVGSGFSGVVGSGFADQLLGSSNVQGTVEIFEGRAGNDTINGRGGFDRADYALDPAAVGGISVNLAAGTVTGDAATVGTDTLISVEAVRGSINADTYDATGFSGSSTNAGSNGTFNEFNGAAGNDTVIGNGNTRLAFVNATGAVFVDLQTGGTPGTGTAIGDASTGTDTFSGVNAVQATMFNDTMFGSNNTAVTETFTGLAGNDTIDGRGGFDIASYNNIYYSTGPLTIDMAAGTATGDASIGTDTLRNIEGIQGTNFADSYVATGYGSGGALNVGSNGNFNQFEGAGGNDTITGNGNTRAMYQNATGAVAVTIGAGGAGSATGDASTGTDTFTGGVNSAWGSNFADSYNASAFDSNQFNALEGRGGNDTITGNGSTQAHYSTATGGVTITLGAGGAGSASGDASVGTDTFTGGVIGALGGNFADSYNASAFVGFNSFQGGGGADTITGNGSTQVQYGGATGAVDANLSTGIVAGGDASVGTDTITGGVNSVMGSNFNDLITGRTAADILNGNAGNDTIKGGGGADVLTGGLGNDNFVFVSGSTVGATITDFTGNDASAGDTLEFHGFGTAAGGATLTFISGTQWQVHSGLDGHNEIINITGNVHASDYQFLA
ncbi:FG-GAP repeat protein [Bradyrhizobium lablabi]|uniref:FG-GAP-like repeat-containing protein n=1 Tax=Bradyrhizobium lablabi TaxID=722472 RepID=UPI001BAA73C1|nr:FG-GAP-like repeat-containing protein [Bradyrhizobium lablabi]MBR1121054.1 FG-GAP repeat protein [Bradyrhizobium lablabi]